MDRTDLIIELFKALSDRTRIAIINYLKEGDKSSSDIQQALNRSQSTVSQQLKTLIQNNIIDYREVGPKKIYFIKNQGVLTLLLNATRLLSNLNKGKEDLYVDNDYSDIFEQRPL